jgi:predicted nucleic acid-binding Zn ribbon protein
MKRERRAGERPQPPAPIGDALSSFLSQSGLAARVEQAGIVPEWPELVGTQIATVTEPLSITRDGLLWVAVASHGWMTELSLLEPELLRKINAKEGRAPVTRIRWVLRRS